MMAVETQFGPCTFVEIIRRTAFFPGQDEAWGGELLEMFRSQSIQRVSSPVNACKGSIMKVYSARRNLPMGPFSCDVVSESKFALMLYNAHALFVRFLP